MEGEWKVKQVKEKKYTLYVKPQKEVKLCIHSY